MNYLNRIKPKRQKDKWKLLIFENVFTRPNTTRKKLVEGLKLRRETVSIVIQELQEDGLVSEGDVRNVGRPGRRELILVSNCDRFVCLSIYIEDRIVHAQIVNLAGHVLEKQERGVPGNAGNDLFSQVFGEMIDHLVACIPKTSEVLGVAFSLIGAVDVPRKTWLSTVRWSNLRHLNLEPLEKNIGIPVQVRRSLDTELDYLLATCPEYAQGNTILFHWGFGIGSSYAHQGQILDSSFGRFGDIGHTMVVHNSQKVCRCGFTGCLETEAALWALLPEIKKTFPDLDEDLLTVKEMFVDPEFWRLKEISRAIDYVKDGLINCFRIFFPDRILLIGHFTEELSVFDQLKRAFDSSLPDHFFGRVSVSVVKGGFAGCGPAGAYPFFLTRLKSLLTARW